MTSAMPTWAVDANVIAFGSWKRGYLLADRVGMRIMQNPFSDVGHVSFLGPQGDRRSYLEQRAKHSPLLGYVNRVKGPSVPDTALRHALAWLGYQLRGRLSAQPALITEVASCHSENIIELTARNFCNQNG